jgi:hypothetical protein
MRFYRADLLEKKLDDDAACRRYKEMRENGLSHTGCYILLETRVKDPKVIDEFSTIYESGVREEVLIRRCPFCDMGCEADVINSSCGIFAVTCDYCDCRGPADGILPEAIRRWNDRYPEPCTREHVGDEDPRERGT